MVHIIVLFIFIFTSLNVTATISTTTDISCLKSIKASFQDPNGNLSSWNFYDTRGGFICNFVGITCWNDMENKVVRIELRDMGLKGQFPSGLENCSSLTVLDLSGNDLQGPIPYDISKKLPFLTWLNLSFNNFSGQIPPDVANCSYLNVLILDHNSLTGPIPEDVGRLSRLNTFNVSDNKLSGPVPNFGDGRFAAENYRNNDRLCGGPLERCKDGGKKFHWRFDYSFKDGFEIGYVVSLVSAVVVYASYCIPWVHIGKRDEMITIPTLIKMMINRRSKKPELDRLQNLPTMEFLLEKEVSTSENFVTKMRFKDLCNATENFSKNRIIGFGNMGVMYKAVLPNGWNLSVKKFYNSPQAEDYFISELKILGRLRHENIIPLVGFCKESKKSSLVYKYISNGNLFDCLQSSDEKKTTLQWPVRMKIAHGLAKGLAWLHHCCDDFRVAHLNINSKIVLLDQNFEPVLSNFGMATFINPREINSDRGFFMDVELWEECFLKEDVFNYGVLLIELISGKSATSLNLLDGRLDNWVNYHPCNNSVGLYDFVDQVLIGKGHDHEIFQCLGVASKCIQQFPEQRPSMLDVYFTIGTIFTIYK